VEKGAEKGVSVLLSLLGNNKTQFLNMDSVEKLCSHFNRLFKIGNALTILLTSLFKAESYCNFLIMKLKLMPKVAGKFKTHTSRNIT